MKPSSAIHPTSRQDARIDAALKIYSQAVPAPGLQGRITARLAANEDWAPRARRSYRLTLFRRLSAGALAAAAACGIVAGSLEHSRSLNTPMAITPQRPGDAGGFSPASGGHLPTHVVPVAPSIDPHNLRTPPHTRARLSRNASRHSGGSAVPSSPFPAGQGDSEAPQQ